MKIHRFICSFALNENQVIITDPEVVHQVSDVLCLKVGERITISDVQLNEVLVRLSKINKNCIEAIILERTKNETELSTKIILYCAILKRENFEFVVQKATEVGVASVVPLITTRTVKLNLKIDRLKKIAREAAEQSGRGLVPKIVDPINFSLAILEARQNEVNIFFDAESRKSVSEIVLNATSIGLFIGPEGGWDMEEMLKAREAGLSFASLGKTILRAETAAMIATYLAGRT